MLENVRKGLERFYDLSPMLIGIVMGILMVAHGLYTLFITHEADARTLTFYTNVIMFVLGLLIVIIVRKDMVRTIGLYALALGSSRLLIRIENFDTDGTVALVVNVLLILLALNLIITGISFSLGRVIRRMSMLITTSALLIINLIFTFVSSFWILLSDETNPIDAGKILIECLMYMALLIMLDSKQIRMGTSDGRHVKHLDNIRRSYRMDEDIHITPEVAHALFTRSGDMWKRVDDGFVEKELVFEAGGRSIDSYVLVQKWVGTDDLRFTVSSGPDSILFANRFEVNQIYIDGEFIQIFGKNGTDFKYKIEKEGLL